MLILYAVAPIIVLLAISALFSAAETWFAGAPGNWRKVLVFFDSVDGGQVLGLALSNNPEHEIDATGNVFVWANLDSNGTEDRLLLNLTDGSLLVVARNGDPTPLGGTFN